MVQVTTCRVVGIKPLSEPMLIFVDHTDRNKLKYHLNRITQIFIHENVIENVACKMASISFRPQ